jgi:competence protein ComEC
MKIYSRLLLLSWFSAGALMQLWHSSFQKTEIENVLLGEKKYFIASSLEIPDPRGRNANAIIEIKAVCKNKQWLPCKAKIYASFQGENLPLPHQYFLAHASFIPIGAPQLPDEFDFSSHMKKKNVFLHTVLRKSDYRLLSIQKPFWHPEVIASKAGLFTLQTLKNIGLEQNDLSVGIALIMGNDLLLEPDIIRDYAATGALHVLSVSGLHVGIVYLLLNQILMKLRNKRRGDMLRMLLLLAGVWAYSIATGLSPSVIRSANMLSMMIIGETWSKKGFSVNTLGASAILQCLFQPASLLEPGFQLSYLAVLGILIAYKPLNLLNESGNPIIAHVWSVCSVSISAQIFTLPLSLYYFQQFPNYFLPANLLVIPVSAVVLYSGLSMLLFSGIPYLNTLNGLVLKYSLSAMNRTIEWMANLPFAVCDQIDADLLKISILYFIIIMLIIFFSTRFSLYLNLALKGTCALLAVAVMEQYQISIRSEWEYYRSGKENLIAVINGNQAKVYYTGSSEKINSHTKKLQRHWTLMGIKNPVWIPIEYGKDNPTLVKIRSKGNSNTTPVIISLKQDRRNKNETRENSYLRGNASRPVYFVLGAS